MGEGCDSQVPQYWRNRAQARKRRGKERDKEKKKRYTSDLVWIIIIRSCVLQDDNQTRNALGRKSETKFGTSLDPKRTTDMCHGPSFLLCFWWTADQTTTVSLVHKKRKKKKETTSNSWDGLSGELMTVDGCDPP